MTRAALQTSFFTVGKVPGPSPAEHRYYVLVMFDIADSKKYRLMMRILKRYATRIQKSVFEARLKPRQIKEMSDALERLMASERYYDEADDIRIYRMGARCDVTVFGAKGSGSAVSEEEDIFI